MNEQKTGLIGMVLDLSFKNLEQAGIDSLVELYKQ
jgi:hypothetical protein